MKRLLALVTVIALASAARAEYLVWQISANDFETDTYLSNFKAQYEGGTKFYAVLRYGTGENYSSWKIAADDFRGTEGYDFELFYGGDIYDIASAADHTTEDSFLANPAALPDNPGAYSYYIEIWRYNASKGYSEGVARSESVAYSDLSDYVGVGWNDQNEMAAQVWHGTGYSIPEPTSAMLLMIGLSLVGLKRKRA